MHAYRHPTSLPTTRRAIRRPSSNPSSNSGQRPTGVSALRCSTADRECRPAVSAADRSVGPTGSTGDRSVGLRGQRPTGVSALRVQRPTGVSALRGQRATGGRPHDDRGEGRGRRLFRRHQSSPANTTGTRRFLQISGKKLCALGWDMITKAVRRGLGYDSRRMAGNALRSSHQFAGEPNHGQFTGLAIVETSAGDLDVGVDA